MRIAKYLILAVILAIGVWALRPVAESSDASVNQLQQTARGDRNARYVLRINPGPIYLPGMLPENATKPIDGMTQVAEQFVKLYPDTRIEFVGAPTGQREWLVTQLSNGTAPDVIQINARETWQDTQRGWYAPLDDYLDRPNPFVAPGQPGSKRWWDLFEYPVPMMGVKAPDGHLYCITLDMIETAIYYNKALFRRLRLREPKDWTDFLKLQQTLQQNGYIPMLIDRRCVTDWAVDLIFDQLYHDLRPILDLNFDPARGEDMNGYLDWDELIFLHQHGFFTPRDPRWRELWRILKDWRQYMSQDLNDQGVNFMKSFITQRGGMLWSSSMDVNRLLNDTDRSFDYGIFYPPPIPQSVSRFCHGQPMCVISGCAMQYSCTNSSFRDTGDPRTSQRLQRVIAFLQFLTTPKSCDTVVNEQIALLPNIKGVPARAQLEPFREIRKRHYSMTKWFFTFDLQFDEVMMRMLELYLNDGITEDQFMDWMERNLNTAAERITLRKKLDFAHLQRAWDARGPLRKQFTELPEQKN